MTNKADIQGHTHQRSAQITTRAIDSENRTAEVSFSSETPVERWFGQEILDHGKDSVRLGRLIGGAPLMAQDRAWTGDHGTARQVGVIQSAEVGMDRVARAVVRFGESDYASEVFRDVSTGIRKHVSVGYSIHTVVLEKSGDDGDTFRAVDWEPLEITIVPIPSDSTVGFNRTLINQEKEIMSIETLTAKPEGQPEGQPAVDDTTEFRAATVPVVVPLVDLNPTINADAVQMRAIGAHFKLESDAEDQIMLGATVEQFRAFVRARTKKPDAVPTVPKIESRIPRAGNLRAFQAGLYDGGRREAEEQAYRAGMFCRATMFADSDATRWCRDHEVRMSIAGKDMRATRALSGLAAGQSVVVPDELILPIINLREEYGVARQRCRMHPMASDTASVPRRVSGATAYFVGRKAAVGDSDPTLDNVNLTARNVAAETRVSNDYAEDSAINLADFVAREHALAFATKEDQCLFNGDGTSDYGGIVGIRVAILGLAGAVDAGSGIDTFLEVTTPDLDAVVSAVPEIPGMNPAWYASKRGEALMFGRLRAAAGGNTKRDMSERAPKQWDGDDIVISQALPKGVGTTDYSNVAMAIYGDLDLGTVFGDRRGMTMLVDPFSLSSYQQTKIIHSERFDIAVHGVGTSADASVICALVGE